MMTDVSDGCLMHVCLKVDAALVRAANPAEQYELLAKTVKSHSYDAMAAEMEESKRVDAAAQQIHHLAKIGLRALLSMKLPDSAENLELRILLCSKSELAQDRTDG